MQSFRPKKKKKSLGVWWQWERKSSGGLGAERTNTSASGGTMIEEIQKRHSTRIPKVSAPILFELDLLALFSTPEASMHNSHIQCCSTLLHEEANRHQVSCGSSSSSQDLLLPLTFPVTAEGELPCLN